MRIVVLFNLKPATDEAYEQWARTRYLPGVRALVSVSDFQIYRATGLAEGDGKPSYRYVGIIDVDDIEGFRRDMASAAMQKIVTELKDFADDPQFILTEALSEIRL